MPDKKTVVFIDFYSAGSLGLRYLENALEHAGYTVKIVFMKTYDNIRPESISELEHQLLRDFIQREKPILVGVSMITSFYIDLVRQVTDYLKPMGIPLVSGGIYATLSPEKCIELTDYVIRGEGSDAIIDLANAIANKDDVTSIKNLAYNNSQGELILNNMRPTMHDMDAYGVPRVDTGNEWLIDKNKIRNIEPLKNDFAYTVSASRGCYFSCSFCGSVNLQKLNAGLGPHVRVRTVENVINELAAVKKKMRNLIHIRFVDSVFPLNKEWINEFAREYKKRINLPFKIWVHPMTTNIEALRALQTAGLYKLIMGIQSGSPYIRNEIFLRKETQEHILKAAQVYADSKIPLVEYDFILCHPFETVKTIKESYALCTQLSGKFLLNINGLKFMPETEIVNIAVEKGIMSREEMDAELYRPMEEQFDFLRLDEYSRANSEGVNMWYKLTYLTQFRTLRKRVERLAEDPAANAAEINKLFKRGMRYKQLRRYRHIVAMVLIGMKNRIFSRGR